MSRTLWHNERILTYIFKIWGSPSTHPTPWPPFMTPCFELTWMKDWLQSEQWTNCVTAGGNVVELRTRPIDPPPMPTLKQPHWRIHAHGHGHDQQGPSCYLWVLNCANTQSQYRCVTEGLCAKYHCGCDNVGCQSHYFKQTHIIPFQQMTMWPLWHWCKPYLLT